MKPVNQIFLVVLGIGLMAGCKARVNNSESALQDAGDVNVVFTANYPGLFIQDVPNQDIAGMEQGNVDAEYGRFLLTFNHNNQFDPELNDGTAPDEPVEAFGTVQNSGKTLILSMGRSVNLATASGANRPEWRGTWPCQDAFSLVEERSLPAWATSESAVCAVGFTGNGPISAATREGSFVFGIKAN